VINDGFLMLIIFHFYGVGMPKEVYKGTKVNFFVPFHFLIFDEIL
jgi:hypothetical protein